MPRGAEALDLPEWNRASGQSSGTRRRSVPQGRPARCTEHAMTPLHSRVLLQGPTAPHALGCFPPWVFSRLHLFSTSHRPCQDPLRCLPPLPRPGLAEASSQLVGKVSQDPRAGGDEAEMVTRRRGGKAWLPATCPARTDQPCSPAADAAEQCPSHPATRHICLWAAVCAHRATDRKGKRRGLREGGPTRKASTAGRGSPRSRPACALKVFPARNPVENLEGGGLAWKPYPLPKARKPETG